MVNKILHTIITAFILAVLIFSIVIYPIAGKLLLPSGNIHANCSCGCDENTTTCCCVPASPGLVQFQSCSSGTHVLVSFKPVFYPGTEGCVRFDFTGNNPRLLNRFYQFFIPREFEDEIDHPPPTASPKYCLFI